MCAEVLRLVGVDRSAVAGKPDPPHMSAGPPLLTRLRHSALEE